MSDVANLSDRKLNVGTRGRSGGNDQGRLCICSLREMEEMRKTIYYCGSTGPPLYCRHGTVRVINHQSAGTRGFYYYYIYIFFFFYESQEEWRNVI